MNGTSTLVIPAEVAERMADRQPRCGNCRFMRRDKKGIDRECHLNPPFGQFFPEPAPPPHVGQMMLRVHCAFPVVQDDFWCAKHEPKLDG
jgi:hypothetical protein